MLRRARAHYMSVPLAVTLAELRSPLEQAYRNTVYCTGTLQQAGGQLAGKYCGNRWCLVCNRIRTAKAMNRYLPAVDGWDDRQLVTLTLRNVKASALADTIRDMMRTFQAIKLQLKRSRTLVRHKHRTWKGAPELGGLLEPVKLVALRKLECTYNAARDDYHPHYHVIVQTRAMADALRERWLEAMGERAEPEPQDVRACDRDGLREVFKYFTKLMAKTRSKRGETGRSAPVDPRALDTIFRAMKRQRVYQPVGFTVAKDDEETEIETDEGTPALTRVGESVLWEWSQDATDWVDRKTGDCLTGYEPALKFRDFVQRIGRAPPLAEPGQAADVATIDGRADHEKLGTVQQRLRSRLMDYSRQRAKRERVQAMRVALASVCQWFDAMADTGRAAG